MLGLHLDDNAPLYVWANLATFTFFSFSAFACLVLVLRRVIRNYQARRHERNKAEFTDIVGRIFERKLGRVPPKKCNRFTPRVVSEVLLFYFRTLELSYAQELRTFITEQKLESVLNKGLSQGVLGDRTRALQVLSYLETDSSLERLSKGLHQGSVYVWLVAARGLARREAYNYIPEIVEALEGSFSRKSKFLKSIFVRFGVNGVPYVERILNETSDESVTIACLETIAHFGATKSRVDPTLYLPHADDDVRAAALVLLAAKDGPAVMGYINGDLSEESVTIRMRAAKLAYKVKRPEFSMQLIDLLEDSHFWVRYWAARAIHALGPSGRDILTAIAKETTKAGRMAGDVLLEMDAANA